jgi:hypothetical protein
LSYLTSSARANRMRCRAILVVIVALALNVGAQAEPPKQNEIEVVGPSTFSLDGRPEDAEATLTISITWNSTQPPAHILSQKIVRESKDVPELVEAIKWHVGTLQGKILNVQGKVTPATIRAGGDYAVTAAAYVPDGDHLVPRTFAIKLVRSQNIPPHVRVHEFFSQYRRFAHLSWIGERVGQLNYRGCPQINVTAEFPEADHPARKVAETHKREMRRRLRLIAERLNAASPDELGGQLSVLINGAFVSTQIFEPGEATPLLRRAADALVSASMLLLNSPAR